MNNDRQLLCEQLKQSRVGRAEPKAGGAVGDLYCPDGFPLTVRRIELEAG